ncbi:MAG: methyltransferase domain-containing protein [Bacteroidales bacterium]|nr:methyltransferase domain-containing protein [Bacteroidales bacterium]
MRNNHSNKWTDADVEAHWDRVAHIYVQENEKVKEAHDQRFIESVNWMDLKSGSTILNISSRDCEANDYIINALPGTKVLNAEISQGLMDVAKHIRPYVIQKKISSYSSLPFKSHTFDKILTLETLEHVEDPIAFLTELSRVAVDNARMVLSCPPLTSEIPYRIYTFLLGGHGEGPHRFLRSSEVKTMLQKTGWKLLEHKGTVLIPVGPQWLQKWGERIIQKFQHTFVSELGIRQFYICEKH